MWYIPESLDACFLVRTTIVDRHGKNNHEDKGASTAHSQVENIGVDGNRVTEIINILSILNKPQIPIPTAEFPCVPGVSEVSFVEAWGSGGLRSNQDQLMAWH